MRFGLLYELSMPEIGWMTEEQVYWEAIEQISLADAVGFDNAWCVEHHFLPPFSYCSAPEVFLAAVAQHTKTMRIGHGVRLIPPPYNSPPRTAEAGAVLDILSKGRLEFGFGRSITLTEMEGFNVNPADTRSMANEAIREIVKMWTQSPYPGYTGKHYSMPERDVVPKPLQKPHPPLWMSGSNPDSYVLAGELGVGCLTFGATTPGKIAPDIPKYKNAVANPKTPVSSVINNKYGCVSMMFCDEDSKRAMQIGGAALLWFSDYANRIYKPHGDMKLPGYESYWERTSSVEWINTHNMFRDPKDDMFGLIGDPDKITRTIQEYEALGVDQLIFMVQCGKISHADTLRSLTMFGKEVIPRFREAAAA